MAGTVNKVILIGNLGNDPEIRTTQSGTKIASLTLATSEAWTDRQSGERKERTEWHRVVIFNEPIVTLAEKYLRKGQKIYVEGSLQTRKWTDQSGTERFSTEIVLARFRGELTILERIDASERRPTSRAAGKRRDTDQASDIGPVRDLPKGSDLDDEIPY